MDQAAKKQKTDGYRPDVVPKALKLVKGMGAMAEKVSFEQVMQVRTVTMKPIRLIGLQGGDIDDQHRLFSELESRMNEIEARSSDNKYLVILPRIVPFVAVEVTEWSVVPQRMVVHTIPGNEYAVFRLEVKYLGEFWDNICTNENQVKYNIDLSKPRFELFTPDYQPGGMTEWFIPIKNKA